MPSTHTIVCVRHGETVWKREERTQGQLDSPLTALGVQQVCELAAEIQSEEFDVILSSPLGRTRQTAEILSQHLQIPDWRQSDHIKEQNEGAFQGLTRAQQIEQFPQCFARESGQPNPDLIPMAESTQNFLNRVQMGLREIRQLAETKNVLVVTHAGVLQALMSLAYAKDFLKECARHPFGFCDTLRLEPR